VALGNGEIVRPEGAYIAFMPQRTSFPLGTLRTALLYLHPEQEVADEKIKDVTGKLHWEDHAKKLPSPDFLLSST
jgi:ABC-type uncharacterized transport system fused permease/ATPase subunit